jgi:hypothetical protein
VAQLRDGIETRCSYGLAVDIEGYLYVADTYDHGPVVIYLQNVADLERNRFAAPFLGSLGESSLGPDALTMIASPQY